MKKMKNCKYCNQEIAASAKVCPHCGAKNKKPFFKKPLFIVLVLILIIGGVAAGGGEDAPSGEQEPITYTSYDVDQLVDDLSENAMKAEETYMDQYVALTGILSTIDSGGDYICIEPLENEFSLTNVLCYLKNDEQVEQAKNLSRGDKLVVKGQIINMGEVLGYYLNIDSIEKL